MKKWKKPVSVLVIGAVVGCIPLVIQAAALGFKSNSAGTSGGSSVEAATSTSRYNKNSSSNIAGTAESTSSLQASTLYTSKIKLQQRESEIGAMTLVTSGSTEKFAEPALDGRWNIPLGSTGNYWVHASQTDAPTLAMPRSYFPVFFNSQTAISTPGFGGPFILANSSSRPSIPISPVPEPESYLMLLAGLSMLGIISSRKTIAAKRHIDRM